MKALSTTATMELFDVVNNHLCPNCKDVMAPVDRVHENGTLFIWYECKDANCGGQWLEKKALPKQGA